jgi:hypothetical protein
MPRLNETETALLETAERNDAAGFNDILRAT